MGLVHNALYIAASGSYGNQRKIEAVSNNLANANTIGYKKDYPVFYSPENPLSPITPLPTIKRWLFEPKFIEETEKKKENENKDYETGKKVPVLDYNLTTWQKVHLAQVSQKYLLFDETYTNFSQGALIETQNPLDISIQGNGFFAVETPAGIRYTRAGNFSLSREGFLVTQEGYRVLGRQGNPIRFPFEDWAPEDVVVTDEGAIFVGVRSGEGRKEVFLDFLKIEDFDEPQLSKDGHNLWIAEGQPKETKPIIKQGYLETSNVNPVEEMISLIESQRVFESSTRIVQSVDDTLQLAIRELGRL